MENTGIIIQARSGSTRLPEKMILPFYKDWTLLDLILDRFKNHLNSLPLVVATTDNQLDDRIVSICKNHDVAFFRGSESNVLKRFVSAAAEFSFERIIRICPDNPFLDVKGTMNLFNESNDAFDYTAYVLNGNIPSIKTHLGFWGEIVSLKALKKVRSYTEEMIFFEHVTNYLYSHTDFFKCQFINAPKLLFNRHDIRLTLDTPADFKLYQDIYKHIVGDYNIISVEEILDYIDQDEMIKKIMTSQIKINSK